MNRQEAYELLSLELAELRELGPEGARTLLGDSGEIVLRSASGTEYVAEFRVEGESIHGLIHDRNSVRFSLLEEKLDFN